MKTLLIYSAVVFGIFLLWSCTDKSDEPRMPILQQLWNSEPDEIKITSFIHDTSEAYGSDYYVSSTMLKDLSAYRVLERHVLNTTDSSATVLRVINDLHITTTMLIPKPEGLHQPPVDYWSNHTPYLLGEICFVIQSTPGTVRLVYLKDRNDPSSLIDTTVEYKGSYIESIVSYPVDSTNEVRLGYARSESSRNRLFSITVSVWTKQRSYHIYSWALWYYADCENPAGWIAADDSDQHLVQALLQMTCDIRSAGGFQAKYGYRTTTEIQQGKAIAD